MDEDQKIKELAEKLLVAGHGPYSAVSTAIDFYKTLREQMEIMHGHEQSDFPF